MFIRWQRRPKSRKILLGRGQAGYMRCWAVLVESVRVKGKPRQRHVAYLGGYYENELDRASACDEFWKTVTNRLNKLSNRISIEDRKKIEKAIARRVLRPTQRRLEADRRRADKILMRLWKSLANRPGRKVASTARPPQRD